VSQYPGKDIERASKGVDFARIEHVVPESPADDAGFAPGVLVTSVNGEPLRDIIDWRWLSADDEITVGYIDLDGDAGEVELWRDEGEEWGFEFDGVVFDSIKLCRNACVFCFMRQLPEGLRPSLTLRDDDYRLSFLSGTFVTLTNLTPADEERIIAQHLSPLRVSLHAIDAAVRREMIGKHAAHGIDALDRLLDAGIEFHAQIVLCPGLNDGDILKQTLEWAYRRPGILNVGIVPLGYTKHQSRFLESFNKPESSLELISTIIPFQQRALEEIGTPWVFAADEFFLNAYQEDVLELLPPTRWYGDFNMFEDGIGIVRSFLDDWKRACELGLADKFGDAMRRRNTKVVMVAGEALVPVLTPLVRSCSLEDVFEPLYVKNDFFGGNVDVTGLLVGGDIAHAVRVRLDKGKGDVRVLVAFPEVIVNDEGLLLDGMTVADMESAAGTKLNMVSCTPSEFFTELIELL
jgi:putative radical SAM enzyme (TIGR03279 family)